MCLAPWFSRPHPATCQTILTGTLGGADVSNDPFGDRLSIRGGQATLSPSSRPTDTLFRVRLGFV